MKLYTFAGAPNPRRVHIYLAEKGIEVPFEQVEMLKRANRTPEFLEKVNVMGGLPVLELDDGSHIAESVAICRYFEALQPEPSLFGRTPKEQAIIEMWIRRIELNFMMPVGLVWVHGSPLTKSVIKHQISEVADQNREVVERYLGFLDGQLSTRAHIAGDDFTMADIMALTTLDFATGLNRFAIAPEHTHLARWHAGVTARPSATA